MTRPLEIIIHIRQHCHGAQQLLFAKAIATPLIDMGSVNDVAASMPRAEAEIEFDGMGINRRWSVYRFQQGGEESSASRIDAEFPSSTLSANGFLTMIWNACEDDDN